MNNSFEVGALFIHALFRMVIIYYGSSRICVKRNSNRKQALNVFRSCMAERQENA